MTKSGFGSRTCLLAAAAFTAVHAYGAAASAQPAPAAQPPPGPPAAPPAAAPAGGPAGYYPPKLEWDKGDPIPSGYHPSTEARSGFVIAGGVTLGVSYAFGGLIPGIGGLAACEDTGSSGSCAAAFAPLLVPAVGPFISMIVLAAEVGGVEGSGIAYAILAIDGLVQSAGAVMLIYGIASPRDILVRNDRVGKTTVQWGPTPMAVGMAGQGFGVRGTF